MLQLCSYAVWVHEITVSYERCRPRTYRIIERSETLLGDDASAGRRSGTRVRLLTL